MHMAWKASGRIVCRGSMTTTSESSSAHVIPVFANSLSRIACGRSHTMPVPADNTRIISIHLDLTLVAHPDMISCCGLQICGACRLHFESQQRARSVVLVVRPSSQHQGCSLRLPRASVVSLFFRAGCDRRGDLESVYAVLCWPLHVLLWIKVLVLRSCQQGSQFRYSRAKATSSVPGTCWSAYRRHLREFGSVSPFCLVRSVTHFKCWPELRAWIVRRAWRNRVGKFGWVRRPSCAVVPGVCFC